MNAFTISAGKRVDSIITPVKIAQSKVLCKKQQLVRQSVEVLALWDTGASCSSISRKLAVRLGLTPVDGCIVYGAGGAHKSSIFMLDVSLPSSVTIPSVRVAEFFDTGAFELIIGMDIITMGDFAVTNTDFKTTVSFRTPPADAPIDFMTS